MSTTIGSSNSYGTFLVVEEATWDAARDAAAADTPYTGQYHEVGAYRIDTAYTIERSDLVFDTSVITLGAGESITAAVLRFAGYEKTSFGSATGPLHLIPAAPADPTSIVVGDFDLVTFDSLGSIAWGDFDDTNTAGANEIAFGDLSVIDVDGYTLLALVAGLDYTDTAPGASGYTNGYRFIYDYHGAELEITISTPSGARSHCFFF